MCIGEENLMNNAQAQAVNENYDKHPTQQSASKFESDDTFVRSKTPLGTSNHAARKASPQQVSYILP